MTTHIGNAADVAAAVLPSFRRWKFEQECFVVVLVDTRHDVIGKPITVAVGTLGSVQVHPRDIFREAVRANAAAIMVAHCHPSGELTPSADDQRLTSRLREAGQLLGIPVLDHVIVRKPARGQRGHVSLAEQGLI